MTRISRRQFIQSSGVAIGAAVVGTVGAGPAAASHMEEAGENITLEYDEALLETYRPRLVFPTEAKEKLIGLYGWIASSPDYETSVAVFWAWYTNQTGWLGPDSHFGDTEPVQVEFDSETGEVQTIRASIYHWIKGESGPTDALMYDDTHPHLRVVSPHHQYTIARPADDGTFVEVKDLTEAYPNWLSNKLEDAVFSGASTVPWRMRDRNHWWRDTATGLSIDGFIVKSFKAAGIGESGSLSR